MLDSRYHRRGAPRETPWYQRLKLLLLLAAPLCLIVLFAAWNASSSPVAVKRQTRKMYTGPRIKVFSASVDHAVAKMQRRTMADSDAVEHVVLTPAEQQEYLEANPCVKNISKRYRELRTERWITWRKNCGNIALSVSAVECTLMPKVQCWRPSTTWLPNEATLLSGVILPLRIHFMVLCCS